MPNVQVHEKIHCPIEKAWLLVNDVSYYEKFMDPVQKSRIVKTTDENRIVEWEVLLKGSILKWTELEQSNPENYRITFEQVDGDLETFSGYWQLTELPNNITKAELYIDFEIGIPLLRDMLNPVATKALEENAICMLHSFETLIDGMDDNES